MCRITEYFPMTDERHERVRELEDRISKWQRVHDHEIRNERGNQQSLKQSLALANRVIIVASVPSAIWLVNWSSTLTIYYHVLGQALLAGAALMVLSIISAAAARVSALAAHWWFRRSDLSERRGTVFMTLSAAMLIFWWVIVLAPL
jgi:hypothetical protein